MSQRSSHLIRVDVGSDLSSLNEYVNLSANDWSISESNMDVPYSWYADTSGYPWHAFQWVTEGNSSATFKFQGTGAFAFGRASISSAQERRWATKWICYVDGRQVADFRSQLISAETAKMPEDWTVHRNNAKLCGTDDLDDGPHTLTINITATLLKPNVGSDVATPKLWLDYFQYHPTPSDRQDLSGFSAVIHPNDSAITTKGAWEKKEYQDGTVQLATEDTGASLTLDFVGTKATFYGTQRYCQPRDGGSISYSIDSPSVKSVGISPPPCSKDPRSNSEYASDQAIIQSPTVELGRHKFSFEYDRGTDGHPLMIDYVVIEGSTYIGKTPNAKRLSVKAIIAITVTLVAFTIISAILFVVYRRRLRKKARQNDKGETGISPFQSRRRDGNDPPNTKGRFFNIPSLATAFGIQSPDVSNRRLTKTRVVEPPSLAQVIGLSPMHHLSEKAAQRLTPSPYANPTHANSTITTTSPDNANHTVIQDSTIRSTPRTHTTDIGPLSISVVNDSTSTSDLPPVVELATPVNDLPPVFRIVNHHQDSGLRDIEVVGNPPIYSKT